MALNNKDRLLVGLLVLILNFVGVLPLVYAENGDGSGGGHDNPLTLLSSTPAPGQKEVPISEEINLHFSKNVVNMTVKDNNMHCFALYDSNGNLIPVRVIMADDQVEPEKKRDIVLKPLQALKPGTGYIIQVAPNLTSKSGVTLGQEINIAFTTAGAAPSSNKSEAGQAAQKNTDPAQPVQPAGHTNLSGTGTITSPSQTPASSPTLSRNESTKEQAPVKAEDANSGAASESPEESNNSLKTDNEPENAVQTAGPAADDKALQNHRSSPGMEQIALLVLGLIAVGAAGYLYYKKKIL